MDPKRLFAGVNRRTQIIVSATFLSGAGILWSASNLRASSPPTYTHMLSSGTFILPPNTHSVDWEVLNDSPTAQSIRVTVYKVLIGQPKTIVGGSVAVTVQPNSATHDANGVGAGGLFSIGATYEVVVELSDLRVLPAVDVWSQATAQLVPGTHINPKEFSRIK